MSQDTGFGPFGGSLSETQIFAGSESGQANPFDNTSIPEPPNGALQTQMNSFNMTEMAQNPGFGQVQPAQAQQSPFQMPQQTSPFSQPNQPVFNQPNQPVFGQPNQPAFNQPSQPMFSQPNMTNFNNNGFNNRFNNTNNQQQRYHIVDMCYLYNTAQDEPMLAIIGFNADFNNLRIGLHNIVNFDSQTVCILKNNIPRLTAINLYSEFCYQILYTTNGTVSIIERTFNEGNNNWTPNKTQFVITENAIKLQTIDMNNNQYQFTFVDLNCGMFKKCLEFMINGYAWSEFLRTRS